MAEGAISCKIEEVVKPTAQARAPEVAAARSIEDKLEAYWKSKGTVPGDDRKTRLIDKCRELEYEVSTEAT